MAETLSSGSDWVDGARTDGGYRGGGPLVVSGGGRTFVSTDGLHAYVERLQRSVDRLEEARRTAYRLLVEQRSVGARVTVPPEVSALPHAVEDCVDAVRRALDETREHRARVIAAATLYTNLDDSLTTAFRTVRGIGAVAIGRMLVPIGLLVATSPLTWALLGTAVATWRALPGTDAEKRAMVGNWVREHPELISNAGFVEGVRGAVTDLDNVALGVAGVPPGLAEILGDDHVGAFGVTSSGAALMALAAPLGMMRDSKLAVREVGSAPLDSVARGVVGRLDRIPDKKDADDLDGRGRLAQVRIERYEAPGMPTRYAVYVAPTVTFSPMPSNEPWDLSSNVGGVAGVHAASFRATEQAMRMAGIGAHDPVQFVGFSQGGLVAGMLAGSQHWNTQGLETTGAPTATLHLDGVAGIDIRHAEDPIPALAGEQPATDRVQVVHAAFQGAPVPDHEIVPAHQKDTYRATAVQVDRAESELVRGQIARMDDFAGEYARREDSRMTVMTFRADRVWPSPSGGGSPGHRGPGGGGDGGSGGG